MSNRRFRRKVVSARLSMVSGCTEYWVCRLDCGHEETAYGAVPRGAADNRKMPPKTCTCFKCKSNAARGIA